MDEGLRSGKAGPRRAVGEAPQSAARRSDARADAAGETDGALYVNYLPMPARHLRFVRIATPLALWMLCVVMFLWGRAQPDPGPGVWDSGHVRAVEGVLSATPYPIVFAADGPHLLVEVGKRGARDVSAWHGRVVRVSGWRLEREGRRIIELEPGEAAIAGIDGDVATAPAIRPTSDDARLPVMRPMGAAVLRGEIVDSKCYLGAMKPGEGKTHKECATLCVRGGIPPVLIVREPGGGRGFVLLLGPDGDRLGADAWPYIADPVEVRGEEMEWGGLRVLRVATGGIARR